MKEIIEKIKKLFNANRGPLTSEIARSLLFFKKEMSYDEMIKDFEEDVYNHIRRKAYCGYVYASVLVPEWVKADDLSTFISKLVDLGYKCREISELRLLIIYWNISE